MIKFFVPEIRIGRIQPLGPNHVPSGNDKQPVSDPIGADIDGIDGDEQGDRRHHGGPDMAQLVQQTGRTSWYFRKIKPVELRAREDAVLQGRPHPDWTIARVSHILYNDRLNKHDLAESASLPSLPDSWRRLAKARLHSGQPEDWACRIETPG